jgi:hypothetical protein
LFHHLKAAFYVSPEIPGLGRLPLNLIFLSGIAILGLGHPGFWLLGLGIEVAFLYVLATSPRFQQLVAAEKLRIQEAESETKRHGMADQLRPAARQRMTTLEAKCDRIYQLSQESQAETFMLDRDQAALKQLKRLYLKLLLADQNLTEHDQGAVENQITAQLNRVKSDLSAPNLTSAMRQSKSATLQILEQRLANFQRRELALEEISSDLLRIEAQIDLAVENTGIRGESESFNIDLVSQLLTDNALLGASGASIAEFERTYERPIR